MLVLSAELIGVIETPEHPADNDALNSASANAARFAFQWIIVLSLRFGLPKRF
jgi:hypothetical protein